VLHEEKCDLPSSPGARSLQGFTKAVDRAKIHLILSRYLSKKVFGFLIIWRKSIAAYKQTTELCDLFCSTGVCDQRECHKKHSNSTHDLKKYIDCLQMQILYNTEMSASFNEAKELGLSTKEPWAKAEKHLRDDEKAANDTLLDILFKERHAAFQLTADKVQESPDVIYLKSHTISALSTYSSSCFYKRQLEQKREDISHAIRHHRVLTLCRGKSLACAALDKEMARIEHHKNTHIFDHKRRKMPYAINTSGKVFPRLWLWATESVEDDRESRVLICHFLKSQ
jgi:hypothetical protein